MTNKILIIDNNFFDNGRFTELFPDAEIHLISYNLLQYLNPKDLKDIDLIVLTGGNFDPDDKLISQENGLKTEIDLIKNTDIPLIGICYGHQLIAKAFGCEISKTEPIERFVNIDITDQSLFENAQAVVWENHKYSVTKLSDEMQSLAKYSPLKSNEIIKHKTKKVWGVQFHPERDPSKQDGKYIIENILMQMSLINKKPKKSM